MNPEKNTQKLFRLWHSSKTTAEIAKELGITASKLTRLAHRLKRYRGKKRVAYIAPTYEYDGHTPTFKGLN